MRTAALADRELSTRETVAATTAAPPRTRLAVLAGASVWLC
jgi:hypothetical protein